MKDLTKTEEGNELVKVEIFDLPATVREATSVFEDQARRKNIEYDVCENPGVPRLVVGDQRKGKFKVWLLCSIVDYFSSPSYI